MMLRPFLTLCLFVFSACGVLSEDAFSQQHAPDGFRFHRREDGCVDTIEYWGTSGLRSAKLHEFPGLEAVAIVYGTNLLSDDVAYLSTLTNVVDLAIGQDLIDVPVKIEGDLAVLAELKSLESVHLCKHDIKDDDLKFVASLPRLTYLEFNADSDFKGGGFAVTDRCAKYLSKAKAIKGISIQGHGKSTGNFCSPIWRKT